MSSHHRHTEHRHTEHRRTEHRRTEVIEVHGQESGLPSCTPADRRTIDRLDVDLRLEIPLAGENRVQQVRTRNISRTGLMFRVQAPVKLPASAAVVLTLPDGRAVTLETEIRHAARIDDTGAVEVGAQFKAVPIEVDRALRATIDA